MMTAVISIRANGFEQPDGACDTPGLFMGGKMLEWLEKNALKKNAEKIILDARVSAQNFYENHGYKIVGDVFMLSYAPVPHILMEKIL